ncbi:hypothetical protein ABZ348_26675 [Streptomyces sp. NPDC005963]|uniref:nSTAND1 domain-containing NTPase n=1 Tax=Streptomyces sp. NPDC005963 TaxID=3156721 RepID=UPI0033E869F4
MAGRRELPVDPQAGPVQEFAHALRRLRREAGQPTYRELSRQAGFSVTTLSLAASGRELPSLKVTLAYVRACGGDVGDWEARWLAAGVAVRDAVVTRREETSPYRGLARYETADSGLFFGRERITADVLDLMARRRFAMVFGPSGSGKTSLLRAAVVPALRRPDTPDPDNTTESTPALAGIRILTPGVSPNRTHRHLFTDARSAQGDGPSGDTLVIVDQFEEVFTLCQDPEEREAFLRMVLAADDPANRLRVVCAARADFYRHCVEHPALAEALRDAHLPVPPMTLPELRDAIVKPAAAAGLIVERELTARLADTVNGRTGALPLLSHALLETWHRRTGRILTTSGYEEAGGLDGAVAATAELLYTRLTASQQSALRQLLLRLVAPGHDDTPDTRRPLTRSELDAFTTGDSNVLVEALARARLITLDDQSLELTHEALLAAWPRLRGWIDEARERLRIHRALTEAAHTWHSLERDPGALYRGTRLTQAEEHLDIDHLTPVERAFLTAGSAARGQEQQTAIRAVRRLRRLRTVLTLIAALALLIGGIAWEQDRARDREKVRDEARRIATLAENMRRSDPVTAMRLGLTAHRISDLPETRAALMSAATQKEADRFIAPAPRVADPHVQFRLTADGRFLLRLGSREVVRWNITTHRRIGTFPGLGADAQHISAMSPDGHLLALRRGGRTVLWDIRTGRLSDWTVPEGKAEFGPSGRTIVVSPFTDVRPFRETVQLREVATGRVLWQLASPAATMSSGGMTAVSADDRLIAVCEPGRQVRLWDVASRRLLHTPWAPRANGPVVPGDPVPTCYLSLRFTKGSERLAQEGIDGVRVWDVASGRQLTDTIDTTGRSIAHSSDGRYLATQGKGSIQLLRISKDGGPPAFRYAVLDDDPEHLVIDVEQRQIRYLMGRTVYSLTIDGAVTSDWSDVRVVAAPGPGNRALAGVRVPQGAGRLRFTLSNDGRATEFSRYCTPPVASPNQECPVVVALSADGKSAAFGWQTQTGRSTLQETLVVVDVRTRRTTAVIRKTVPATGFQNHLVDIAFGPDGTSLLASRWAFLPADHWDLRTRTLIRTVPGLWGALAPRPGDGAVLAASGNLLEVESGRVTSTSLAHERVDALAYSPDGKHLVTANRFGRVALWDSALQERLAEFPADSAEPSDAAEVLAFSPDNRILAAGAEGAVQLWDVTSLQRLGTSLPTAGSTVSALSFSPDSRTLHATYGQVPPRTYRLDPASLIDRVCARVSTGLSETDWKSRVKTVSYRPTCAKPSS